MEATERPWEHTGGDIWIDTRVQVCCGRGTYECCGNPDVKGGQELVAQTSEANASLIVRAVNQHDALLKCAEALRKALPFIDDALDAHSVMSESAVTDECKQVVSEARDSLSLLEKTNG